MTGVMRYENMGARKKRAGDSGGFSQHAPKPQKTYDQLLARAPRGIIVTRGDLVTFPNGDPWFANSKKIFRVDSTKPRGWAQSVQLVDPDSGLKMKYTVLSSMLAKVKVIRTAKP